MYILQSASSWCLFSAGVKSRIEENLTFDYLQQKLEWAEIIFFPILLSDLMYQTWKCHHVVDNGGIQPHLTRTQNKTDFKIAQSTKKVDVIIGRFPKTVLSLSFPSPFCFPINSSILFNFHLWLKKKKNNNKKRMCGPLQSVTPQSDWLPRFFCSMRLGSIGSGLISPPHV